MTAPFYEFGDYGIAMWDDPDYTDEELDELDQQAAQDEQYDREAHDE